jgi:predicted phosphohydrolase
MTPKRIILPTERLLILSDLHLDKASPTSKADFLKRLRNTDYDSALITGDISVAPLLSKHLGEITQACGSRPVIITTGNHDYYGSSFREVDHAIETLCADHTNLTALGDGEIIELSRSACLVGHRGWFDGLAGSGAKTRVESPDRYAIEDFRNLGRNAFFRKLKDLGEESADYFRRVLPLALSRHKHVLLATHFPPFTQGIRYEGKGCVWNRQPYFANQALGNLIWGLSRRFSNRKIQVQAGHTHSAATVTLRTNLSMRVAGARPGSPSKGELLTIS